MKKNILVFLLLFSVLFSAQESKKVLLQFDKMFHYIKVNKVETKDFYIYTNTENQNYYLLVSKVGEKYVGDLRSFGNQMNYFFNVDFKTQQFNFFGKERIKNLGKKVGGDYTDLVKKDDNNYELIYYKNKKKTTVLRQHFLETEASEKDLFYLYRVVIQYPLDDEDYYGEDSNVFRNQKFLVKKSIINYKNSTTTKIFLQDSKSVNLSIEIPEY